MTNDINGLNSLPTVQPPDKSNTGGRGAPTADRAETTDRGDRADRVTLTPQGLERHSSEATAKSGQVVDKAKVDAVRTAIDRGEYRVDAEAVATKLMELERRLYGSE